MTGFRSPSTRQSGEPHFDPRRPRVARRRRRARAGAPPARRASPRPPASSSASATTPPPSRLGPFALVTTDSLVEGVHFRRDSAPPRLLGRKALTVNLSDVAAMGGLARYATVSLCLPAGRSRWAGSTRSTTACWSARRRPAWRIVGGNVTRSPGGDRGRRHAARRRRQAAAAARARARATASWSRARSAPRPRACGCWRRARGSTTTASWPPRASGRSPRRPPWSRCLRAQLDPRPPLALARAIGDAGPRARRHGPLGRPVERPARDLRRRAVLGAVVDARRSAGRPARRGADERARGGDALSLALHGGEDYQLLLAVAPDDVEELGELAGVWGVPIAVRSASSSTASRRSGSATARASGRSSRAATTTSPRAAPRPSPDGLAGAPLGRSAPGGGLAVPRRAARSRSASSSPSSRSSGSTPGSRSRSPSSSA